MANPPQFEPSAASSAHPAPIASTSYHAIDDARRRLAVAFPDCVRDGTVDLDRLRELLDPASTNEPERYGLGWPGRRDAVRLLQQRTSATLVPRRDVSSRFDEPQHLLIEGENLEVLKLLHRSYHDQVKVIYIDPPYNRPGGRELVYLDNYAAPLDAYLRLTGQLDDEGNVTVSNAESQGRRHSQWLSMMYPRLKIAQQLLAQNGLIFASIDDHEGAALRFLLDEIFGEANRVAELIWVLGSGPTAGHFLRSHETVLCYARDKEMVPNFEFRGEDKPLRASALKKISRENPPSEITFPAGIDFEGSDAIFAGTMGREITQSVVGGEMRFVQGKLAAPVTLLAGWAMRNQIESWLRGDETRDTQGQRLLRLYFNSNGMLNYEKERSIERPRTVIQDAGSTADGSSDIKSLGLDPAIFDFPKPVALIEKFIRLATDPSGGDLVLDFFAGSGTSAHAVARLNANDGGNRRSISVQIDEPTPSDSIARASGYARLSDITRARIAAAFAVLHKEAGAIARLRVLHLAPSNFRPWNQPSEPTADALRAQLDLAIDRLRPSATPEDIAFEIALREGYGVEITLEPVGNDADRLWRVRDNRALIAAGDRGATPRYFFLSLAAPLDVERLVALGVTRADLLVCQDSALDDTTAANLELGFDVMTI
jgi:adenine-specific DNA-methyltransferase